MFKSYLTTSWRHIRRMPYQALAAVSIMSLTFFIAAVFILLAAGSQAVLRYFETRPQVTAFFQDEVSLEQVEALKQKLTATGKVAETRYVSKEEALAIYREQNKDDPLLLEMVTANILPASLEVKTSDIAHLAEVAQLMNQEPGVEEVIFQEDVVAALSAWSRAIRIGGAVLVGFMLLVSVLIILVITGMKIAIRREEIEIMRLIGASNMHIRAPFLLEGAFYGGVGALLAWLAAFILLLYSTPFLVDFLTGIPLLPVPLGPLFALLGVLLVAGLGLGSFASFLAVRRYLR